MRLLSMCSSDPGANDAVAVVRTHGVLQNRGCLKQFFLLHCLKKHVTVISKEATLKWSAILCLYLHCGGLGRCQALMQTTDISLLTDREMTKLSSGFFLMAKLPTTAFLMGFCSETSETCQLYWLRSHHKANERGLVFF